MKNDRNPTDTLVGLFSYTRCTKCDGSGRMGWTHPLEGTKTRKCYECGGAGVIITEHTSDGTEAKCQKVEARSQQ